MKTTITGKVLQWLTCNFIRAACHPLSIIALAGSVTVEGAITGQWDFQSGDLSATTGIALDYFDGPGGVTSQQTVFGTTTNLGLPDIGGQPAHVMGFPAASQTMGYVMRPGMAPNGGGSWVNQYTLIFDLLYPPASSGSWRALIQIDDPIGNANDADLFINTSGGIGISGSYQGQVLTNTWHRLAFAVDLAASGGPLLRKYIDGQLVGQQILGDGVDGRWALNPVGGSFGDTALLFTDDNGSVAAGYVSSIQVHDEALSEGYIQALGAPTTDGIPTNVVVPVTVVSQKPAADAMNVAPDSGIEVVLADGSTPLDTGTIVVKVNSQILTRTVTSAAGEHTVLATLPTLDPRSTNTLTVEFTDPGLGAVGKETSFRMAAYVLDAAVEQVLTNYIAAYWRMDDGLSNATATLMVDSVGDNHSTITAGLPDYWLSPPPASRFGGALHVDGDYVYAIIQPSTSLDIGTNAVTLSLWVKLEQLPSQLPQSYGSIYDSQGDQYVIYTDKGNRELRFKVTTSNGPARPGIPESKLKLGEWLHIVGVYDGNATPTAGEARIYMNGELMDVHVGSDSAPGTLLTGNVNSGQLAGIGRAGEPAGNSYVGAIDDVAIWSQALTVDAIGYLSSGHPVPAGLTGTDPLIILQQPQDVIAIPGTRATFEVVRSGGTPPVTYQWKHAGTNIDGATTSRLDVRAEPETAGTYTVVLQDVIRTIESNPALLTLISLPTDPQESLLWGMNAHWRLDDGLSNPDTQVIADAVAGSDGDLFGGSAAAWLAEPQAKFGGALQLDGTNVYAIVTNWPALDINQNQVTLSLWVWLRQLPADLPGSFGSIYDSTSDNYILYLDRGNDELRFKVTTSNGAARPGIPAADLVLNQWLHVVGVYDGNTTPTAGEARIYLDGVLKDTEIGNNNGGSGLTGTVTPGQVAGIGRQPDGTGFFYGVVDDIGVWNRALTTDEINYVASGHEIPIPAPPRVIYANDFEAYSDVATNLADEADADVTGSDWIIPDDDPVSGLGAAGSGVQVVDWAAHSGSKALLVRSGSEAQIQLPQPLSGTRYNLDFWLYVHQDTGDRNFYIIPRGEGSDNNGEDFIAYRSNRGTSETQHGIYYYDGVSPGTGWTFTGATHVEDTWQHHRMVVDPNALTMDLYIDNMSTPVLTGINIARSGVPVPTIIRLLNEGNSADDGYFVIDDISLTVDGSVDLTTTFIEGFENYPARVNTGDNANPQGPWITTETAGTGTAAVDATKVQVVNSDVVTPHSGSKCLKLEGGQRASATFAWGNPPGVDVQITWWARVPASVDGTTATYLRMSLYGAEDGKYLSGDNALLGYGSRDATIGDETSLTYYNGGWIDSGIDYTPDIWEEYRLTTHTAEGRYTIVKNPSGPSPQVIANQLPMIGTATSWNPVFMAAWSSSNGSGHPPVYIDDIEISSFGLPTFSIVDSKFVTEGFQLSWGSVAGATYEVWRGTDAANPAGFENISGDLTGTTFIDTNPPAGGAFYKVVAKQ